MADKWVNERSEDLSAAANDDKPVWNVEVHDCEF
jgi:hypothetical protein